MRRSLAMPIYLVRWASFTASLVRARNEAELLDILDQEADPGGCTYEVYRGPLFIDFALPFTARPRTPDAERLEADGELTRDDYIVEPTAEFKGMDYSDLAQPGIPCCDAGLDMLRAIVKGAFPALSNAMEAEVNRPFSDDDDDDEPPTLEKFEAALHAEVDGLVRYQARVAALDQRTDPEAALMKVLDLTVIPPTMAANIETAASPHPRGRRGPKAH